MFFFRKIGLIWTVLNNTNLLNSFYVDLLKNNGIVWKTKNTIVMSSTTAKPTAENSSLTKKVTETSTNSKTETTPKTKVADKAPSKKSMAKNTNTSDDKVAAARKKNLDLAISQIQKDFGETAIIRLGDGHRVDVCLLYTSPSPRDS